MLSRNFTRAARYAIPASRITALSPISPTLRAAQLGNASSFSVRSTRPAPLAGRRWYSDAAEKTEGDQKAEDVAKKSAEGEKSGELEALKNEVAAKNKEVLELKDKYLRSIADYRNLQERTKREAQSARDFALQKFAKDLVSTIDTFEAAIASIPPSRLAADPSSSSSEDLSSVTLHKDLLSLHEGLKMTESQLIDTLKKHGIERFDPAVGGEKFDPNMHEATFQAPMQGKEEGTVFHTQRKGFLLNGRVLRAAQVGIVKNS